MKRKKLLWTLFQSYLVITLLCILVVALSVLHSLKHFYLEQVSNNLKVRAELFENMLPQEVLPHSSKEINRLCVKVRPTIGTRITVILPTGVVVGDSETDYQLMDNHRDRPEIKDALSGRTGMSIRYSYTIKKDLMYVAIPVVRDNQITGAVRASMPVMSIVSALENFYFKIAMMTGIIALIAVAASFLVSQWINRPIKEMIQGAASFAEGNLHVRLSIPSLDETRILAETMNSMAAQLNERIRTITEQKNELEAVLSCMVNALLAVDNKGRIIECNPAAQTLFMFKRESVLGKYIHEVVRNPRLQHFISETLINNKPLEDEIVLHNNEDHILQLQGTQILDSEHNLIGAVIVFNDITKLNKLETIRRDFVANVSHELKTPITSIIGFVETLKDGAIKDTKNRQHFLDIIVKHAERLNTVIEDLLTLSRIDQDAEKMRDFYEQNQLCPILGKAISLCKVKADEKDITINLDCDEMYVKCNAELLDQAVVNLIDNAIKYSDRKSVINVKAYQKNSEVIIEVEDFGCGIPEKHLPRIFERFYRVDKARSRNLGGTGLGLAIAKHIINAHGGRISVESIPGKGSTFSIILPVV